MTLNRIFVLAGLCTAFPLSTLAQTSGSAVIAFVNVNVVPMDSNRVESGATVLVRGDRIVAVGASGQVSVPPDATVIDGSGQYLVPGLTDAHVHLAGTPLVPTRDDFGDAPMYLAYGVTTVVNLSGSPAMLDWRKRVAAGSLSGPTIYTSGPFVNEPRVNTPDEVERDIVEQSALGYDLIKFHEFINTTTGLSRPAYRRMIDTAKRAGMPLIGHAPANLGIDEMLQAHQSLAHVGMLNSIYFLPVLSHTTTLLVTVLAAVIQIGLALVYVAGALVHRTRVRPARTTGRLSVVIALFTGVAFTCVPLYLPGGPLFDSVSLRLTFTALAALIVVAAVMEAFRLARVLRDASVSTGSKMQGLLGGSSAVVLAVVMMTFWIPVSWRSSDLGIDRVTKRIHDAGMFVQSTLIAYEVFNTNGRTALMRDSAINDIKGSTRDAWRRLPKTGIPLNRLTTFNQKVIGALHRNGVPIMAGTDALGLELVPPGSSLHREFQLLSASGLSPYDVLRTATVVPAAFLGRAGEFGTIAPGQRADLLLVAGNPLEDLTVLMRPSGVLVRGAWLTRATLDDLMNRLATRE